MEEFSYFKEKEIIERHIKQYNENNEERLEIEIYNISGNKIKYMVIINDILNEFIEYNLKGEVVKQKKYRKRFKKN